MSESVWFVLCGLVLGLGGGFWLGYRHAKVEFLAWLRTYERDSVAPPREPV